MEATFQREGKALCTDRSCRGRAGGRGSLLFGALNPVICRGITKWQHNSSWNRRGRKGCGLLTPFLKSQTHLFPMLLCRSCFHREHKLPDSDRLGFLTPCTRNGHTTLCSQSQKGMMILRSQDSYAEQGSRSRFLCVLHLEFIYSEYLFNTRSSVQPEKHGAPWL